MEEARCPGSGLGQKVVVMVAVVAIIAAMIAVGLMSRKTPAAQGLTKTVADITGSPETKPEDVIKTMEKVVVDDQTGYRFAHLTTIIIDGTTQKVTHMNSVMSPLPMVPRTALKPETKPEPESR